MLQIIPENEQFVELLVLPTFDLFFNEWLGHGHFTLSTWKKLQHFPECITFSFSSRGDISMTQTIRIYWYWEAIKKETSYTDTTVWGWKIMHGISFVYDLCFDLRTITRLASKKIFFCQLIYRLFFNPTQGYWLWTWTELTFMFRNEVPSRWGD